MNRFHILVVEDNPADAFLTEMALRKTQEPMDVHVVETGDEALRFMAQELEHAGAPRPDLVLLDLNLPGISGHDVLRRIKEDPTQRSVPVVVFSSSESEADVRRSYELHANCYIAKPIELERFTEVMALVKRFWLDSSVRVSRSG